MITVPTVPAKCAESQLALNTLNSLITAIEEELSFIVYLQTALDSCCESLKEELIEK
jgi:hypothetical protein